MRVIVLTDMEGISGVVIWDQPRDRSSRHYQEALTLMLWDLYGEGDFQEVRPSYLRGTAGYLLVVDGMRAATLETARKLRGKVEEVAGPVPFILVVNKADLREEWELEAGDLRGLRAEGWEVIEMSAKTGAGVEKAFSNLASRL